MRNPFQYIKEVREKDKARREAFDRRWQEAEQRWESQLKPLPMDEAKQRATGLLSDSPNLTCSSRAVSDQERRRMLLLAPHLREFFERFSNVSPIAGNDECLDRSLLTLPDDPFLLIGLDGCENNYYVKPGDETIRIVGPYCEDGERVECPSVWHLILKLDLFGGLT